VRRCLCGSDDFCNKMLSIRGSDSYMSDNLSYIRHFHNFYQSNKKYMAVVVVFLALISSEKSIQWHTGNSKPTVNYRILRFLFTLNYLEKQASKRLIKDTLNIFVSMTKTKLYRFLTSNGRDFFVPIFRKIYDIWAETNKNLEQLP
jgi:hypothetical protein